MKGMSGNSIGMRIFKNLMGMKNSEIDFSQIEDPNDE